MSLYINPLPVRIWHWLNALCFVVLIATGAQIRYREAINILSFPTAVLIHNIFGMLLIGVFGLWLFYHIFSGKIKLYIPKLKGMLPKAIAQAKYYGVGIMKHEPNPHHITPDNKFNPIQQMTYLMIMSFIVPAQIVTGLFLFDIDLFGFIMNHMGGLKIVACIHVVIFMFSIAFMIGHIYLSTLGHTALAHIKAMITGWED